MAEQAHIQDSEEEANAYASREDFRRVFDEGLKELYQLSFLLTRDLARAERCLVRGLEDCEAGNSVFREWARSWAKRAIIQNAIREVKPGPNVSNSPPSPPIFSDIDQLSSGPDKHFEVDFVLGLEDFERFVFVMSILEHYSDHDCALLLRRSVVEIREARIRALTNLEKSRLMDHFPKQIVSEEKK
jgi:DNA-directed RNA polymerase specialized sigma24 family protein